METERIELSARDRERLKVLQQVEEGHLRQVEAAKRLRVSDRQVRRWQQRLRKEGDRGIVHRLRGRRSNRKIPEAMRKGAITELRQALSAAAAVSGRAAIRKSFRPTASRPCGSHIPTQNSQQNQIPSASQSPLAQVPGSGHF